MATRRPDLKRFSWESPGRRRELLLTTAGSFLHDCSNEVSPDQGPEGNPGDIGVRIEENPGDGVAAAFVGCSVAFVILPPVPTLPSGSPTTRAGRREAA